MRSNRFRPQEEYGMELEAMEEVFLQEREGMLTENKVPLYSSSMCVHFY